MQNCALWNRAVDVRYPNDKSEILGPRGDSNSIRYSSMLAGAAPSSSTNLASSSAAERKIHCRVGRGISAPAPHRTVRDSLKSYGSCTYWNLPTPRDFHSSSWFPS